MRERSRSAPRRRGPRQPLPPPEDAYDDRRHLYESSEPPYYSIDNTEEIYGMSLLPSQRSYVDPWDLENYDYVRKKLGSSSSPSPSGYYNHSLSLSPAGETVYTKYYYMSHPQHEDFELAPRRTATMPRNRRQADTHFRYSLECDGPQAPGESPRSCGSESPNDGLYGRCRQIGGDKYEDYMTRMTEQLHLENEEQETDLDHNFYTGFSSSSSVERKSSLGDDSISTMFLHTAGFGVPANRRRSIVLPKPQPQIEFPAPPPLSTTYESCSNPYATLPCCSVTDCYECLYVAATPSAYGGGDAMYGGSYDTLGRRPPSSLYSGIYASKFGMSKKGLLQIDYSCSWNDLDRVMSRNF